jgi:hypothetical protein
MYGISFTIQHGKDLFMRIYPNIATEDKVARISIDDIRSKNAVKNRVLSFGK